LFNFFAIKIWKWKLEVQLEASEQCKKGKYIKIEIEKK